MGEWNPEKYLMFKNQRTQPAFDLANHIRNQNPASIVDIGCGPGNSTEVLRFVFPNAEILGIDSSEAMINKATEEHREINFKVCDAESLDGSYDLLFSNACLQWIPNHEKLIPNLLSKLNDGGVLAVQIPMNQDEPLFCIIRETAEEFKYLFENVSLENNDVLMPSQYYNILSKSTGSFEMWETVYYHVMPSHNHLIEWVRGTRLRPYLNVLGDDEKKEFEKAIFEKAVKAYPLTDSGEVIFKFRRFFFTAYK